MSGAEPILTANEERAAAALRLALRHESEAWPLKVDAGAWLSGAPRRRRIGRRLWTGIAAALAVALVGVIAYTTLPLVSPGSGVGTTASAGPSIPGTAGHFDNGDFSFDYPSAWQTLSGQYDETIVNEVDAVLGTGSWRSGCLETMYPDGHGNASCTGDSFDVSGGRVVVKVWRQVGGPVDLCGAAASANATLGPNAVLETRSGSGATWEIREPGGQFGWGYNVFVEAHTDDAAGLAAARALVASFRWAPSRTNGGCYQPDTPSPS
jgi:hypothetical protein